MKVGDTVEDFEAHDQNGDAVKLRDFLALGPLVLYFYPRAMTSGCTKESCHFRDVKGEFAQVGASIVGISADPVERQRRFDERNDLGFPLLSDPDRTVAASFGVKRPGPLWSKRTTFVIDTDRTVFAVFSSELNMDAHADQALEVLRTRLGDDDHPA
jgi:thioredoxin-dependent peroxiredoxin